MTVRTSGTVTVQIVRGGEPPHYPPHVKQLKLLGGFRINRE